MTIAIMQPYIFPYIGYFQLIYASDVFVFYDDVNFINRGWINRNRILLNGTDHMITVPCKDASQNKLIKDIEVLNDPKAVNKLLTTIKTAYSKAPFFVSVFPIIEEVLATAMHPLPADVPTNIAGMAAHSVLKICDYLGINRTFRYSSLEYNNRELKKADRLIDICHVEGIKHYINASGGKAIYTKEYYAEKGIELDFLNSQKYEYNQQNNTFVPWLSIIDVLMYNSIDDINNKILPLYHLY
jgi:hypothetical protein